MPKNKTLAEEKEKKWTCALCVNSSFNDEKNFKTHQKLYHAPILRRFVCVDCGKKFTTAHNLIEHHKSAHKLSQLPKKSDLVCEYIRNTRKGIISK